MLKRSSSLTTDDMLYFYTSVIRPGLEFWHSVSKEQTKQIEFIQLILRLGNVDDSRYRFNAELVENAIMKMKCGKAAGLENITVEHLRVSHYLLYCILCKLFNFMLHCSHVPDCFGMSYIQCLL